MTTIAAPWTVLPPIARLGFDDGWLLLRPTFLNFGLPGLLIDYRLVGPADLGLELFGTREPTRPWASATVHLRRCGGNLTLWSDDPPRLVTARWLEDGARVLDGCDQVILLVGDTRAVQLSWNSLWSCVVGIAAVT